MPLKPKSGKRGAKPASFDQNFDGTEDKLSQIVLNNAKYFGISKPETDDEAEQRIADMFRDCVETKSYPTVEKLAACLGISRHELQRWVDREDKGSRRSRIIKDAKEKIAAMDAEAVVRGKLNTVAYIFRAKNYYGLTDNVTVEHKATLSTGEIQDQSMLVGALLKQLQGQATIDLPQSDYQPQPSAIETAAEDFLKAAKQATMTVKSQSDYQPAEEHQATMPEIVTEGQATMPSDYDPQKPNDYETELPSDYASKVQATISPLSALGKALAEETSSDYSKEASDYQGGAGVIELEPDK